MLIMSKKKVRYISSLFLLGKGTQCILFFNLSLSVVRVGFSVMLTYMISFE